MVHPLRILTLVIGVITSARTCPNMCRCKIYPRDTMQKDASYYTSVNCDTFFGNLSRQLENSTKDISLRNLSENKLSEVLNDLAENAAELPFLTNLIIIRSGIGNFNASLDAFDRILSLTLTDNGLDTVPGLFSNLTNLRTLDLSQNAIESIEEDPFRTLHTLEVLNLSANALAKINPAGFSGLNSLKCLDLSRNNLTVLGDEVLVPLSTLQHLNLSNNHLETLNEQCFGSLIMLQQLDVSWNRLARVASLQLPSLARLLLAGNPQLGRSREVNVLVGTGRKLQTVDASRTGLKQVPAALTHSIRTLRLAGNSIRSVNCGDLDSYPLLQLLDFTSNSLRDVEEDSLGRLESLSILYFSDNNIGTIPQSLPEKLKVLHLEHNAIERVSNKDLLGLDALEVLLLSDNKIRVIDEAAFTQLVSLVTLDLSRNPVTVLQPGCLSGPSALQVLRLASIGIISPAEEVSFPLSTTEHLITLDLSGSPGLARQFLADTAALAAARELQELDLSRTDLEFIRSDMLHYLPQLRVLHVGDNRLNCSHLQWLAAWLRRQVDREYRDVICASPADLWGTPLVDLQDEDAPIIHENAIDDRQETDGQAETRQYTTESTNFPTTAPTADKITITKLNKTVNQSKVTTDKVYSKPNQENEVFMTNFKANSSENLTNHTEGIQVETPTTKPKNVNIFNRSVKDMFTFKTMRDQQDRNNSLLNKTDRRNLTSHAFSSNASDRSRFDISSTTAEIVDLQWNGSTGETSMYINNKKEGFLVHPSMLLLGVALMGAIAALAMLATRCTRWRRSSNALYEENIEVSSISRSVTELW